jgi:hypothetical protein
MFATKIRFGAILALLAMPALAAHAYLVPAKESAEPGEMFPDGLVHDFGKVPFGAQLTHSFRIVNTYNHPIRIVSLRIS